ncbi:hypothetical protein GCM10010174_38720 [Kutzneria viridogrisea]|uniref:DUF4190 domain-containing protein n=1 Tax=Kutzneria viridogrisea TaxID=47990 RepID=A0ABR6BUZ6_9PSEU|nr:hypothetical protein [Kutzneria viridogrisea]
MGDYPGLLGGMVLVEFSFSITVVSLFALGIRGLAQRSEAKRVGASGVLSLTTAIVCFTACVAIVAYGLSLMLSR